MKGGLEKMSPSQGTNQYRPSGSVQDGEAVVFFQRASQAAADEDSGAQLQLQQLGLQCLHRYPSETQPTQRPFIDSHHVFGETKQEHLKGLVDMTCS